ncbi:hypothetical protein RchiOBHm_Chr4g0422531 [Rosa chinensis]|uniref:Uncharacterized protein n=1 Tax=Rosa chinensis TaxID=74649 RepID=A0A2P6QYF6_ROSCH|nr:hypothetical protein RchiOBHm_Chr4g0422531 [Rosa chinensis]
MVLVSSVPAKQRCSPELGVRTDAICCSSYLAKVWKQAHCARGHFFPSKNNRSGVDTWATCSTSARRTYQGASFFFFGSDSKEPHLHTW